MITTLAEAQEIAGTLSKPSKMPGYAYGLPASQCKTGAVLHAVKGSTCSKCYALKGRYVFPNVQRAQFKRLFSIRKDQWVGAMVFMIRRTKNPWFRWHDSGDIQDVEHLQKIFEVCRALPGVQFWLPTREMGVVRAVNNIPQNLVIRVSDTMIDREDAVDRWPLTSGVSSRKEDSTCPANPTCGQCRACWSPKVSRVVYHQH